MDPGETDAPEPSEDGDVLAELASLEPDLIADYLAWYRELREACKSSVSERFIARLTELHHTNGV